MNADGGRGARADARGAARKERGVETDSSTAVRSSTGDARTADVGTSDGDAGPTGGDASDDEVAAATTGVRGWALVGVVVTCFLVVPGVIYLRPAAPGQFGLPFLVAMLALPMLPALLLGLTAVWSMKGPRDEE